MTLFFVALGGALGAAARYLTVVAAARAFGAGFPWGVALANVAGSVAMGVAAALILERAGDPRLAALLMPGFLGGFTTFSAFSLDAARLMEDGRLGAAAIYVGGSVALAVLGLFAGLAVGRALA
ncbi:MAG: CrcB family protein [Pseudomonadota bacterium]